MLSRISVKVKGQMEESGGHELQYVSRPRSTWLVSTASTHKVFSIILAFIFELLQSRSKIFSDSFEQKFQRTVLLYVPQSWNLKSMYDYGPHSWRLLGQLYYNCTVSYPLIPLLKNVIKPSSRGSQQNFVWVLLSRIKLLLFAFYNDLNERQARGYCIFLHQNYLSVLR